TMAQAFQAGAQLLIVINLAIENDLHRTILIADGLVAARQVNNRQAAMDEADPRLNPEPFRIRPAVRETIAHGFEQRPLDRLCRVCIENPSDAAHGLIPHDFTKSRHLGLTLETFSIPEAYHPGRNAAGNRIIRNRPGHHGSGRDHTMLAHIREHDGALSDPGVLADGDAGPDTGLLANRNVQTRDTMLPAAVDDRNLRTEQDIVFQGDVTQAAVQPDTDTVA